MLRAASRVLATDRVQDFNALVRRDHDDLDQALVAMVATATRPDELVELLDVFRLALAVHVVAEAKVLARLLAGGDVVPALRAIVEHGCDEHLRQQAAADALVLVTPGSEEWYAEALELRIAVLDHATRAELLRWTLRDHLSAERCRRLSADYATERMRVLARTSPQALAREAMRVAL